MARKVLVGAMVKMSFVALSGFTLLATGPSAVAASTQLADDDGPGMQQQVPAQSGSGAPIQHIPGNAGTGDAATASSGSKSKGTKKDTKDTTGDGTGNATAGGSVNTGGNATGDTTGDGTGNATGGASVDTAGDDDDNAVGTTGKDHGVTTVNVQTNGNGTVVAHTETTTFADGSRTIRVFNNGVLVRTVSVPAGAAVPDGVLGAQQGPAGQGNTGTTPTTVAGQQAAPSIAMLPATSTAAGAPAGILGASVALAGAWLLRRGRKA